MWPKQWRADVAAIRKSVATITFVVVVQFLVAVLVVVARIADSGSF